MFAENFLSFLIIVLVSFSIIEISLIIWINLVRRKFQWLITNFDKKPELNESGLKKFFAHGYDSELGWIRKHNSSNYEIGKNGKVKWTTNDNASRTNPGFENEISTISCYGDSFTFSRQVNDNETWEHELSNLTNSNVTNFGVGNYGIDQAFLRLKREFNSNRTKIVILAVVPDTISRIMSYWKHYYEYGNTFAFKPRFKTENTQLVLIQNIIDHESKFQNYQDYLKTIQKHDFFYENKFKKEIINFPYTYSFFKNFKRNIPILYWVTILELKKKIGRNIDNIDWKPMSIIMKINLNWRKKLFKNEIATSLLIQILKEYVKYSKEEGFVPVFTFLPQKDDLLEMKRERFDVEICNKINKISDLITLNIVDELLKLENYDEIFSDPNDYGGHYSKSGNEKIGQLVYEKLKENKVI